MAKKKYFTASDVNGLIPELERTLAQIEECRKRAAALSAQLPNVSALSTPEAMAQAQIAHAQTVFLMSVVEDDLRHIGSLGGVVKSLDEGLIDFPGQVRGKPVWICWRRGEPKARFWHGLNEGFAARQQLQSGQQSTRH